MAIIVSKEFTPSNVVTGETSRLTITITTTGGSGPLTGISFNDLYPAGLQNTATPNVSNTTGGIVTAAPNGTSISLTGGSIGQTSSVSVGVDVVATMAGNLNNSTGDITSIEVGSLGSASAILFVTEAPPTPPTRRRRRKGGVIPSCPTQIEARYNYNSEVKPIITSGCGNYSNPVFVSNINGVSVYRYTIQSK